MKSIAVIFYLIFILESLYLINLLLVRFLLIYLQNNILEELYTIQNFILTQTIMFFISKLIVYIHQIMIKKFNIIFKNNFLLELAYGITNKSF